MIWTLAAFAVCFVLYKYTAFGNFVKACGGNRTAAIFSGVKTEGVIIKFMLLSGICAALCGMMTVSRMNQGRPDVGVDLGMDAITAVVLGGTPFTGGSGSLVTSFIGAFVLITLTNALVILGVPTTAQTIASEKYGFIRFAGGSFPYDVGVYYVTALLSLLGPVKRIAGFARPAKTHQCRNFWDGNAGKSWDLQGNNVVAASLQFERDIMGSIHFNGESISDEMPALTLYGTEGILCLGNPGSFDGKVTLVRKGEGSCEIPFTHGYKGYPLYGAPTPFDWGGHRGIGVVEMAYSIREGRKHRASKEMGLHTMEVLCGIDIASDENRVYEMTTFFALPRALPSGYLAEEMSGTMRSDSEISLAL